MINSKVLNIVGIILSLLGLSMIPSVLWSYYFNDPDSLQILYASIITTISGIVMYSITYFLYLNNYTKKELSLKDGFTVVSLAWIMMAIFSALPYYISLEGFSFTNSFFEAMSGLTTTGSTILGSSTILIEELSHGLLFWRSFTQFIGGMGIIVFSIAILPLLGIGGVQLFKAEVAGPTADKITPRIKQTAKLLWSIYIGLIFIIMILFYIQGMTFFDSICHSLTTISTAGFSTHSESIKFFNSPGIEWTMIFFMFIAATNFSLHYSLISNGKFNYFKNEEFKTYFFLFIVISLVVLLNISYSNITNYTFNLDTFRHSMFTTTSLLTTSGFVTENYEQWPNFSKMILFILFFLGGSAGSTTGGLKLIRTILIFKYLFYEMKKLIHPSGVYSIKIGKKTIGDEVVKNTLGFYLFYFIIFISAGLFFSFYDMDLVTSLSASASSIGNIGPALGTVGPYDNWGHFPPLAKWVSCFCMLLGRLEIFTVMILFSRLFWRH